MNLKEIVFITELRGLDSKANRIRTFKTMDAASRWIQKDSYHRKLIVSDNFSIPCIGYDNYQVAVNGRIIYSSLDYIKALKKAQESKGIMFTPDGRLFYQYKEEYIVGYMDTWDEDYRKLATFNNLTDAKDFLNLLDEPGDYNIFLQIPMTESISYLGYPVLPKFKHIADDPSARWRPGDPVWEAPGMSVRDFI